MANEPANYIAWIDCEMTGLYADTHDLVEIAVILTDFELQPLHSGLSLVINPGADALGKMNDFVTNMHRKSGLLAEIEHGLPVADAEAQVIAYLEEYGTDPGARPLLAGNTIGMDRSFIQKHMPKLDAKLHYRSIDVSSIKELSRRWFPGIYAKSPEKLGAHRGLVDITESIRELAYLRGTIFTAQPGPSAAEIKEASDAACDAYRDFILQNSGEKTE